MMKNKTEVYHLGGLITELTQRARWVFSFDKKRRFNMFADHPWKLTSEQKEVLTGRIHRRDFSSRASRNKPIIRTRFGGFSHALHA